MKPTLTVACISLKSVWQAVSLRSALTALLLAPLAALPAADPNEKVLANGSIEIRFSSSSGAIVGLRNLERNLELIAEPKLAQTFRLLVPLPGNRFNYLEGVRQKLELLEIQDGKTARLRWSGLTGSSSGAPLDIAVEMMVSLRERKPEASFRLKVENRTPFRVEEVWLAPLSGTKGIGDRKKNRVYASNPVYGKSFTVFDYFDGTTGFWSFSNARNIQPYPTSISMPWVSISNGEDALYLGLHDSSGDATDFVFDLLPHAGQCFGHQNASGMWPDAGTLSPTQPLGVQIAAAKSPSVEPGQTYEMPDLVVSFQKGTWHAAADRYREWTDTWMQIKPRPAWVKDIDSWYTVQLLSQADNLHYRFSDLPGLAKEAKEHGVRAMRVIGWNRGGQDSQLPDNSVDPRLGTREELIEAIRQCEQMGVRIILFCKFKWADRAGEWTKKELHRYVMKDPFGNPHVNSGWGYDTLAELNGYANRTYYFLCHSSKQWQEIAVAQWLKEVQDLGSSGIHIDEGKPENRCYDTSHGHPYGVFSGVGWSELLRRLHESNSRKRPDLMVVQELFYDIPVQYHSMFEVRAGPAGRDNRNDINGLLPINQYTFPEARFVEPVYGLDERTLLNFCILMRAAISYEPLNFKGRLSDIPANTSYGSKLLEMRRNLADYLWHGKFRDILDVNVQIKEGNPKQVRWTRYEHKKTGKPAIVVVNAAKQPAKVTVTAKGGGDACVRYRPEALPERQQAWNNVVLPAESIVVLVAQ